ncbi:MAG: Arc family DNA-binding protein [Phascolarctobacterium sp.]|nr:hypothetical protein [Phascolarctobacterium sp.]MUU07900.1 Arc family DNA-binding protein [Phascolarctobacterium sp.]MUU17543.1 Arc family DNA-binding protein [Phascolarctobacterium sp.]
MVTDKRAFTMRMQPDNFEKIKFISEFNKRSIAMQIEFLIEQCVADFELQHGKIKKISRLKD